MDNHAIRERAIFQALILLLTLISLLSLIDLCRGANEDVPMACLRPMSDRLCRVYASDGSQATGYCVGRGYILTAGHLAADATQARVNIQMIRGQWYWGKIIAWQRDNPDICLIQGGPAGLEPVEMAMPVPGEPIYAGGWAHGTESLWLLGRIRQKRLEGYNFEWVGACPVSGHSGGPVLNAEGKYLGPLWGGDLLSSAGGVLTPVAMFQRTQLAGRYLLPWNARANGAAVTQAIASGRSVVSSGGRLVQCAPGYQCYPQSQQQVRVVQGPAGPAGRDGVDGRTPSAEEIGRVIAAYLQANPPQLEIDYQSLADEVHRRLPPMRFEFQGGGEAPSSTVSAHLGETVQIPPLRVNIMSEDGSRVQAQQVRRLGGKPIQLRFYPMD